VTKLHHRRKLQYVFGGLVGGAVLAVLLFFLVFHLPVRREYSGLEESIAGLRAGIVRDKMLLEELEGVEQRLANASESRQVFLSSNLVSRELGYAALIPDLVAMAESAGIERPGASYQISDEPMYGIYPVEILQPLQGSYSGMRRFIEQLESSDRFFLLDSLAMGRNDDGDLEVELLISAFFADHTAAQAEDLAEGDD
jgi:hypothetical protein